MLGRYTYLVFELSWAIPVLALQWAVGWRELWRARRVLAAAVLLPSAYLSMADGVAIQNGIWAFHRSRILGTGFGGVPLEEIVFFLLTNALVAQAVILVLAWFKRRPELRPPDTRYRGAWQTELPSYRPEQDEERRRARE